jgi:hypothetical protein
MAKSIKTAATSSKVPTDIHPPMQYADDGDLFIPQDSRSRGNRRHI